MFGISQVRSLFEKGFLYLLSSNFIAQLLSFGTSLLITRFLTPTQLGETKILQSYIILFLVLAGFGFNSAVLKYCSENRSREDRESILRFSILRSLPATAGVLLIMAVLTLSGILTPSPHLATWLLIYATAIPFIVMTDILTVYLLAVKRARDASAVQAVNKALTFAFIVSCTLAWKVEGYVIGAVAAGTFGLIFPLLKVGTGFMKAPTRETPPGIYSLALFGALANGITTLGQYGDIFILDHFVADRQAIGHYTLATLFILAASQFTITIQSTLTPYFSERGSDRSWLSRNLLQNQLLAIVFSLAAAAGVYGVAMVLIRFVYGSAYQPTLSYLLILLIKYFLFSSYAIISAAFIGLGLIRFNFYAVVIATPVGLLLSYLLQRPYSAYGVAWAQVAAAAITLVIMLLLLWRAMTSTLRFPHTPTRDFSE